MFERYTEEARLSLFHARLAVEKRGGTAIEPEHLLLGILRAAPTVVRGIGLDDGAVTGLVQQLKEVVEQGAPVENVALLPFSARLKAVLEQAGKETASFAEERITPEHLLLACLILGGTSPGAHAVIDAGVTISGLRQRLAGLRQTVTGARRVR